MFRDRGGDASLANPTAVAVDPAMNVYLADPGDREVRVLAGAA